MNEQDAQQWIRQRFGDAAFDRVAAFLDLVVEETGRQNLISPATIPAIWSRHAADSAQLVPLAGSSSSWMDIGTGGGFPGLIVACLTGQSVTMVEPRKLRADFLQRCVDALDLGNRCTVRATKVENVSGSFDVVSARAVSGIGQIVTAARSCVTDRTRWLLPRGRYDPTELEALRRHWSFMFHVEHSLTAADSVIVVLEGVTAK